MRPSILAVVLSTASLALGQAAAPGPGSFQQKLLIPPSGAWTGLDRRQVPQTRQFSLEVPQVAKNFSSTTMPQLAAGAAPDQQMIVHPPPGSVPEQAGIQIAQNLYPGLQLLPIEDEKTGVQPIPTAWPELKVEPIPIGCSKCRTSLVQTGGLAAEARK
jgi:hypothetical protein